MHIHDESGNAGTTRSMIFAFLVEYKRQHDGNPPSTREIADACSVSISTVSFHLTRLEVENLIRIEGPPRRMIEVTGGQWGYESGQDSSTTEVPGDARLTSPLRAQNAG